ncbi:MAG: choice-of-anchor B family protein [Bacteroidetes bacterium]|nr:choice-of-anchor B family protein [Bacteroidota bacterium]
MIRKTLLFLFFFGASLLAQTNIELISNLDEHNVGYNDIWGYVDPSGNEYALLGVRDGTSIISLADPSNPFEIAFIPGTLTCCRDIKVHGEYAYVVSSTTSDGLQIIDLTQLPDTATLANQTFAFFDGAHNIFIENGYAYVVGTNNFSGGMHILDLSNPTNPTRTATYTASGIIHDVYVWDDTVVVCAGTSGEYHLVDVTNKTNPQFISASAPIPGIFPHSGWMTEDKRYFYGTEESGNTDITVWDLIDRSSWDLVIPSWETQSEATVHNLFILGNYAHISYYADGYVVLDISDPLSPFLVGEYDTSPVNQATFTGAWGAYPYLPSRLTIISDIETGLYVFQFTPGDVPPVIIHTEISDILNNDPIPITANITDNEQVIDANLHYRTTFDGNTSDWFLINDLNGPTNNLYEFEIPGQEHLTTIEYYLAAVDNNDNVSTLPAGGSGINPPGSTPPPDFFSFKVVIPGTLIIQSFFPLGDTTIQKNGEIDFMVNAIDTSGLELTYQWFKNDVLVGANSNTYHYRHSSFDPPPHTDVIKVNISNGYIITDKTWNVFVEPTTAVEDENNPRSYSLKQNYPNPFNPSTQIRYSIANSEFVNLSIFNSLGEKVAELVNQSKPAGEYTVTFDAGNFSSGVYIARITAGSFIKIIKMTLLK